MESKNKAESFDLGNDFTILTSFEKRVVFENAKNLLEVQKKNADNLQPYELDKDFSILTTTEKGEVLKSAKHLLKLQKDNALLALSNNEPEKQGLRKGFGLVQYGAYVLYK